MIHPYTQEKVISESVTGSGTTVKDIVIQGGGIQLGVVLSARTSGSLTIEVYPLVDGQYQATSILSIGPLSSASNTAVIGSTESSWSQLRVVATYTGTMTYLVHAKAFESAPIVTLATGNTYTGTLGETGNLAFAFIDDITIQPGEMITVAAQSSAGTPSYVIASMNTREDQ